MATISTLGACSGLYTHRQVRRLRFSLLSTYMREKGVNFNQINRF